MCEMLRAWWSSPGGGWRKVLGNFLTIEQTALWWETRKGILRELLGVRARYM